MANFNVYLVFSVSSHSAQMQSMSLSSHQPAADKLRLLEPFFRRIEQRDRLSSEERQALIGAVSEIRTVPARRDLLSEGDMPQSSMLLASGFAARYAVLASGGRQITAFQIAGDFVDLQAFPLRITDHSVIAITTCTVLVFPHAALLKITEDYPHLTRLLWMLTLLDAAIHRQWLVVMGRMSALGHMAHLFCEHFVRAQTVGLAIGNRFPFPVNQSELADALGLSIVHVNRTLQELRRQHLLVWEGAEVNVLDWPALMSIAQFDDTFLHLQLLPR
ncbi:MAG: Crp/Fnr family transcriptional regulator [Devosia sp.]|nr:Crp/Fnr family transcriptional regulator [Devosia sp.]